MEWDSYGTTTSPQDPFELLDLLWHQTNHTTYSMCLHTDGCLSPAGPRTNPKSVPLANLLLQAHRLSPE